MKRSLLLLGMLVVVLTAFPKDKLKVRCISEADHSPVAYTSLSVEYPDTIICYQTDRKGKISFSPSSYPLTVTARAEGMYDAIVGLMSRPSGSLVIELTPDLSKPQPAPRRRADWSTDRRRRLSSTYTVRR